MLSLIALLLLPASASADDLVVQGRGWGHGVGMSQFGAYGYARDEGRNYRFILGHYYTGTDIGTAPSRQIRVRLKRARTPKLSGASVVRAANGRRVRLREERTYRFRAVATNRIDVIDSSTGRRKARLLAPVRATGGATTTVRGTIENGLRNGAFRGTMVFARDGGAVLAINRLNIERYLYGVVAAEMPSEWAAEALKAQAVVARSYALRSMRPTAAYDVFATVQSQVYRGVAAETANTTAAVRGTRGRVVTAGGEVAQTFFFSTSGGRTATNEEAFGGTPLSYLRSVDDPHDSISPVHQWTARFTEREANRKLRDILIGKLVSLEVRTRTPSGRAATVTVHGTKGDEIVSGARIQFELGLRSTWITSTKGV